jgi:hypothetical protein
MKKLFTILALLSMLMVPCVSMAATMSDADLGSVTGQSGVDITISSAIINLSLGTLTWGDYDGFTGATTAGYVNVVFYPVAMHIGISGLAMSIDVGTNAGKTAVNIGIKGTTVTVDALVADIVLDAANGAVNDYEFANGYPVAKYSFTSLANVGSYNTKTLGVFGISGIKVTIPDLNVQISAH